MTPLSPLPCHNRYAFAFFLKYPNQFSNPVPKPQRPAGKYSVQNHRSRDRKDLTPDPEYLSFFFKLNTGSRHRICKSGDRNQSSRAPEGRKLRINIKSGQNYAQQHQNQAAPAAGSIFIQPQASAILQDRLSDHTDNSAGQKRFRHIFRQRVRRRYLFDIFIVSFLFFRFQWADFLFLRQINFLAFFHVFKHMRKINLPSRSFSLQAPTSKVLSSAHRIPAPADTPEAFSPNTALFHLSL